MGMQKEDLLNIACQLFLEKGYMKSSVREIAKEAEVTPGLITCYFKSKREMAAEILKRKMLQKEFGAGRQYSVKTQRII